MEYLYKLVFIDQFLFTLLILKMKSTQHVCIFQKKNTFVTKYGIIFISFFQSWNPLKGMGNNNRDGAVTLKRFTLISRCSADIPLSSRSILLGVIQCRTVTFRQEDHLL